MSRFSCAAEGTFEWAAVAATHFLEMERSPLTIRRRTYPLPCLVSVEFSKQHATTLKPDPLSVVGEDNPRRRAPWRSAMRRVWLSAGGTASGTSKDTATARPVVRRESCDTANDRR